MNRACYFLCDISGVMARPWADAGYECWCVDIAQPLRCPSFKNGIHFVYGDARSWEPKKPAAFVAAFPICTHTAVSGARDFQTKGLRLLADSLDLFNACYQAGAWSGAPFMVENPVGVISSHFRKPDAIFDPCDYAGYLPDPSAELYTKKTCLWFGNGFVMPPARRVEPVLGSKMHRMPPGEDRQYLRSLTPAGFARPVFEVNSPRAAVAA